MAKQDTASAFLKAIRKGETEKTSPTVKVSLEVDRAVMTYFETGDFGPEGGTALDEMHRVLRAHVKAAQTVEDQAFEEPTRKGWLRR